MHHEGRKVEEAPIAATRVWALSIGRNAPGGAAPADGKIIGCLEQIETVKEFRALVRMLLPEYETENHCPRRQPAGLYSVITSAGIYPLPANTDCHPADW